MQCQQKNSLSQDESVLVSELKELEGIPENQTKKEIEAVYLGIPEESRTPDPDHPVIELDIIAARSDVREIKISDLYSGIRYVPIKFKDPIDTIWDRAGEFDFLISPNNIIASYLSYGITQFDLHGNFMNQIVKNDFYYTSIPGRNAVMVTKEDRDQFIGAKGQVYANGDMIYYQYHNLPEGHGAMMSYNAAPGELTSMMVSLDDNTPDKPKGSEIYRLSTERQQQGAASSLGAFNIFPVNEDEWASTNSKFGSSQSGSFLVSTNLKGDTITKFKDYAPIRNFSGSNYRALDGTGSQYQFQGISHIRQGYNDTIYKVINSNRLMPKYVLNFGAKGIQSPMEGFDPRFDLKEKYVIDQFIETNKYIFIIYTQDYPCPNTEKNGTLLYNACIYDKAKQELFHAYKDQKPFVPTGNSWPQFPIDFLKNDLDKGPAFWPKKTTHDGLPFTWFKINEISKIMPLEDNHDFDYLLMIAY